MPPFFVTPTEAPGPPFPSSAGGEPQRRQPRAAHIRKRAPTSAPKAERVPPEFWPVRRVGIPY